MIRFYFLIFLVFASTKASINSIIRVLESRAKGMLDSDSFTRTSKELRLAIPLLLNYYSSLTVQHPTKYEIYAKSAAEELVQSLTLRSCSKLSKREYACPLLEGVIAFFTLLGGLSFMLFLLHLRAISYKNYCLNYTCYNDPKEILKV